MSENGGQPVAQGMLKIDPTSWHYRLWKWPPSNRQREPHDLCGYFWELVAIVLSLILTPIAIIVLAVVSVIYIIDLFRNPWHLLYIPAALGVLAAIIVVLGLFIVGVDRIFERRAKRKKRKRDLSTLKLIGSFISAKKKRLCPLIEVKR